MRTARNHFSLALLGFALLAARAVAPGTTHAQSTPVLGSAAFATPNGEGWGSAQPRRVYNGGDPSGLVTEIQWTSWGAHAAIGYGLGNIFKPHGGYYHPVVLSCEHRISATVAPRRRIPSSRSECHLNLKRHSDRGIFGRKPRVSVDRRP